MLPSSRELTFAEPISRMGYVHKENRLNIITDSKDLHQVDLNTLDVVKSVSLSNLHGSERFDFYKRPFALKDRLLYVEFSTLGREYVLETKGKIRQLLSLEQNTKTQVTKACFSEDGKLLVTGNERGFAYVLDAQNGSIVSEFFKSADAVCAVAISPNNIFAARASFEGILSILDIESMKSSPIEMPTTIIEMMRFIDDKTLLAITRDSKILKIDVLQKRIIQEESFGEGVWPSELCISASQKFAYIGTRSSKLFVFRLNTLQNYYSIDFKHTGVTAMVRTPRYFIVGFQSGEVVFYNHRQYEQKYVLAIELKNILEATSFYDKNIFLMSHRATKGIYDQWLEKKESLTTLLANGALEEAEKIAKPFIFHPKCAMEFGELEALQPEFMALNRYIRSKSYRAAYEVVQRTPMVKNSMIYARLEKTWMDTLQKAQIILARNPVQNREQAMHLLKPFEEVESKKKIIEKMLTNASSFTRATNAVKNRNFSLYYKLVEQHEFLIYTPLYKRVNALAEKIQNEIIALLKEEDYKGAMEKAKALSEFTPYISKSRYLEKFANGLIMINYHLDNGELFKAVSIKDELRMQGAYAPLVKLEKQKELFQRNMLLKIHQGEIEGIFERIKPFFDLQTCKKETAMLMKHLYIEQMWQHAKQFSKKEILKRILKNYFHYFRMDKALLAFVEKYELKETAKELAPKKIDTPLPAFQESIVAANFS